TYLDAHRFDLECRPGCWSRCRRKEKLPPEHHSQVACAPTHRLSLQLGLRVPRASPRWDRERGRSARQGWGRPNPSIALVLVAPAPKSDGSRAEANSLLPPSCWDRKAIQK